MWPYETNSTTVASLSSIKRVLYLGTWHHIEPAINQYFSGVKEFIFIDTQPRSEFDDINFDKGYYNQSFVEELTKKCENMGYIYVNKITLDKNYYKELLDEAEWYNYKNKYPDINPTLYIFNHHITGKKIKYYISTNFEKNMTSELKRDITKSDAIIISGYYPKECILDYFTCPKIFIGYTDTIFPKGSRRDIDFLETDNIISYIISTSESEEKRYFNSYYLCSYFTNQIIECNSILDIGYKTAIEDALNIRTQYK